MMNIKRILKIAAIGILFLLIVAAAGLFIWSATSTYPAGELASAAMESSSSVSVSQDRWIVFTPEIKPQVGVIFYPGGLVAPEAYAPVLRELAERGYLVVLTPMPLNLAIFNTNTANAVIEVFPEITDWILAGHSLGGAAASIYAENYTGDIDGLALWDSYPPDSSDLSDNDIEVISIYGTTGGTANTDNFEAKKPLLPQDTTFASIEGASHAQFGDYGPQKGDVVPSISAAEQHEHVAALMLVFIDDLIR
jgi:pimeloyl-ACP methyl ester carboxylesterase